MAKGSKDCLHETWAAIGSDITGDLAHTLNQSDTCFLLNIIIIMGHLNPLHNAPCLTSFTVCLHKAFHASHHASGIITLKTTHKRIICDITSCVPHSTFECSLFFLSCLQQTARYPSPVPPSYLFWNNANGMFRHCIHKIYKKPVCYWRIPASPFL